MASLYPILRGILNEQLSILVVEDDPNHQLLIQRALRRHPELFSIVEVAGDLDAARRLADQLAFDGFLVDHQLPDGRGLDFILELREKGCEAPCILMTSAGSEDLVVQAFRHQVTDYQTKDVDFWQELPDLLRRAFTQSAAQDVERTEKSQLAETNKGLDEFNTDLQFQFGQCRRGHLATRDLLKQALASVDLLLQEAPRGMEPAALETALRALRQTLSLAESKAGDAIG